MSLQNATSGASVSVLLAPGFSTDADAPLVRAARIRRKQRLRCLLCAVLTVPAAQPNPRTLKLVAAPDALGCSNYTLPSWASPALVVVQRGSCTFEEKAEVRPLRRLCAAASSRSRRSSPPDPVPWPSSSPTPCPRSTATTR